MKNKKLYIIAGPCSIDKENEEEIYKLAEMKTSGKRYIWGVRVVGLKSRTVLNRFGEGMGIDFEVFQKNLKVLLQGGKITDLEKAPSVKIAERFVKNTGLLVATEIMDPLVQLPLYDGLIFEQRFLAWNPAVNQLGWPLQVMGEFAKANNWYIGLKNPKWVGEDISKVNSKNYKGGKTTMEKTWEGLASYAYQAEDGRILIHRGVDVPEKGKYRNLPVHWISARVKQSTGLKLFFDPSHSYGPKMRQDIVPATIEAMRLRISEDQYLYDGILIEVGRSQTDTEQHISISDFKQMCERIFEFRELPE